MQNSATAKTKWAPKHRILVVGGVVAVAALLLISLGWWLVRSSVSRAQIGSKQYVLDIANSGEERRHGLSNRPQLSDEQGMLFVFPEAGKRCIWMKDMQFSIDVIWLDSQKRVIKVYENMTPDTYPRSFCPTESAQYVIELQASQVHANGIKEGQTVSF